MMRYTRFALVLAFLFALPGMVGAQGAATITRHRFETTLLVDARPLQAEVLVDGRPIGTAGSLGGAAIAVLPGVHTVEIRAAGFHPYAGQFIADPMGFVSQFKVTLVPER